MFYAAEKIAVIIDGHGIHRAAQDSGFSICYASLRKEFARRGRLQTLAYVTSCVEGDHQNPLRPLIDFVAFNGYTTTVKPVYEFTDASGKARLSDNNIEVEFSVEVMRAAPHVDHMVLATNNQNFVPLIKLLQDMGKRVSVITTAATATKELRRAANNVIRVEDLRKEIEREPLQQNTAEHSRHSISPEMREPRVPAHQM